MRIYVARRSGRRASSAPAVSIVSVRDVPFTRSLPGRLWRRRESMRSDWERRARENAPFYICTTAAESAEAFAASGEKDLEAEVLDGLPVSPDWAALEIGCGIGRLLKPLSKRVRRAVGVDLSDEMIRRGREYCADRPNVELLRTEGALEGLADGAFDFVFSHIVFQHLPRKAYVDRYLREAHRVLEARRHSPRPGRRARAAVLSPRRRRLVVGSRVLGPRARPAAWSAPGSGSRRCGGRGRSTCGRRGDGSRDEWRRLRDVTWRRSPRETP